MKEIFLELGYKVDKPVGEMMNDLNEDPNFLYEDTEDRKKIVIDDYNQMVKEAEEDVRPYFYKFPSSPVEVRLFQSIQRRLLLEVTINHQASMARDREFFTPIFMI